MDFQVKQDSQFYNLDFTKSDSRDAYSINSSVGIAILLPPLNYSPIIE